MPKKRIKKTKRVRETSTDEDSSSSSSGEDDEEESNRKKKRRMKKKAKKKAAKKKSSKKKKRHQRDDADGEKPKHFEQEVAEAMARQGASELAAAADDRKRGYNSIYDNKAPTEAEMEAYYRKRSRDEDPMKHF